MPTRYVEKDPCESLYQTMVHVYRAILENLRFWLSSGAVERSSATASALLPVSLKQ